jgi:hypothetical protein
MQQPVVVVPVFRFNLSETMVDALLQFTKTHQHDDRETYSEAWTEWKRGEGISILFENETERLKLLGYGGSAESIEDKIFKSGRYYFRNKSFIKAPATKRSKYISTSKELISAMDEHIVRYYTNLQQHHEEQQQHQSLKPSELFIDFCTTYIDVLKNEIERLVDEYDNHNNNSQIISKIKKTYKNRIFNKIKTKKK